MTAELLHSIALDTDVLNYVLKALEEAGFNHGSLSEAFDVVITAM